MDTIIDGKKQNKDKKTEVTMAKIEKFYKKELLKAKGSTKKQIKNPKNFVLRSIQKSLNEKELLVMYFLYGINDGKRKSYKKAGEEFNVTIDEIKEIEHIAFLKILPSNSFEEWIFRTVHPTELATNEDIENTHSIILNVLEECSEKDRNIFKSIYGIDCEIKIDKEGLLGIDMTDNEVQKIEDSIFNKIIETMKMSRTE